MKAKQNKIKDFLGDNRIFFLQVLMNVFTVCLYAPFEMYLLNRSEFWFKLSLFWWMPLLFSVFMFVILVFVGCLFPIRIRNYYGSMIFSGGICLYLQGNFLNLRVGIMNGGEIDWSQYRSQMIRDIALWIVITIVLFVLTAVLKEKYLKATGLVSVFLISVQFISLITLLVPVFTEHDLKAHVEDVQTDAHLYEVGTDGNILVFILDMFDDDYFREILQNEEPVLQNFDGFTYFDNFTGKYSTTADSLDFLLSGQMCYNELPRKEWREDKWSHRLWLDEVVDEGYEIDFYTPNHDSIPDRMKNLAGNYEGTDLYITDKTEFFKHLYRLVACRYFPDVFKPEIWMDGTEFDSLGEYFDPDDSYFRNEFNYNHGLTLADGKKEFKFIHIMGAHYPYHINEDGTEAAGTTDAYAQAEGTLSIVAQYLDAMKENGTYDESAIILTADHGYYWDGVLSNPVCLIKRPGDTGVLSINDAPVSQQNLFATIVDFCGAKDGADYGTDIFDVATDSTEKRYFYQYYLLEGDVDGNYRMIEYEIPPESNDISGWKLTDVEYTYHGEKISHTKYCDTCNHGGIWLYDHEKPRMVHVCSEDNPSASEVRQLEHF